MTASRNHPEVTLPRSRAVERLVAAGHLRPATRTLEEFLAERGPLTGPVTDAGTRAVEAGRAERQVLGQHG
ncbi:MAG: hypothetical protein WKF33_11380 [Thermoleophilaceae bacterium]